MKLVTTASLLAFALAVPACAADQGDQDLPELDGEPIAVQQQALSGSCTPQVNAAITGQWTQEAGSPAWSHPGAVTIELNTLTRKPFRLEATKFSKTPYGVGPNSFGTSTCAPTPDGKYYRCYAKITAPVHLCHASGDYQIEFQAIAEAGSGCGNTEVPIDFRIATQNLCDTTEVSGGADPAEAGVAAYQAWYYGMGEQRFTAGFHDIGALTIGNDTISSLRVAPGWKVTVFEAAGFQGASKTFTADVPWIGDEWNDRISSLYVERQ